MEINPGTELGKKVLEFLRNNPTTIKGLAQEIGIAAPTLTRLLTKNISPTLIVQLTIEKFLKKYGM